MKHLKLAALSMAAAALISAPVSAREPGVLPAAAPGATIGVPIAAPLPEGMFFASRTGMSSLTFHDASGQKTATKIDIIDTAAIVNYVPGFSLMGGQYRASVAVPIIDVTLGGNLDAHAVGLGSIDIRPVDISWALSEGIFMNAGVSILTPGDWSADRQANPGQNFWSVAPSVGVSYLRDGWNATGYVSYTTNQKNNATDYLSGDEVNIHLTAMKDVGDGLSVGPVAYMRKQVSNDTNNGTAYGGDTSVATHVYGVGVSVTKPVGSYVLNGMFTHDLDARDSGSGSRIWLNFARPL